MTEPLATDRLRELLVALRRLVADRARDEVRIPAEFRARNAATEKPYRLAREEAAEAYEEEKAAIGEKFASTQREITSQFESDYAAAEKEYDGVRDRIRAKFDRAEEVRKKELQDAHWEATTVFDASKDKPGEELAQINDLLETGKAQLVAVERGAVDLLERRWQWRDYPPPIPTKPSAEPNPLKRFLASVQTAEGLLDALQRQTIGRLFEGPKPVGLFLLLSAAITLPAGFAFGWDGWGWIPASALPTLGLFAGFGVWFYRIARRQSSEVYLALRSVLEPAEQDRRQTLATAKVQCERRCARIAEQLDNDLKKASDRYVGATAQIDSRKQKDLLGADQKYPVLMAQITARQDRLLNEADKKYTALFRDLEARYQRESKRAEEEYREKMAESKSRFDRDWSTLVDTWQRGIEAFQSALDETNLACDRLFPDWNSAGWENWSPPTDVPRAIRFGRHAVDVGRLEGGLPEHEDLHIERSVFTLPAMLPFPDRSLLLLKTTGPERSAAADAIGPVMLRLLTSMPPGKVRFTVIDPVGLGEDFSAFMHLADYDEKLVASRIWTDSSHIDQRLTDLTEHMETVIQVYLRNEFETIQDYNQFAGEMAEPYRILVVANFPANFSEAAAARLKSIVSSGARCGVFTLMNVDAKAKMPRGFRLADLMPHAGSLRFGDDRFAAEDAEMEDLPLTLEEAPAAEVFTAIVRDVGSRAEDAGRVEVSFECIAPEEPDWWKGDSAGELDVPLGRAGAMKLQHLSLGRGTSQHVLMSGKTGSGKSTLLHVLITNLAVRYSPAQVEFYLVDFKKGVEFKAYATHSLPHARVIAIESEREFGLSVLERLDAELKRRGDMFRNLGVQDLAGFRTAKPDVELPRVLLIIDEFQELFVEDDRLAQSASLLLDRLVRQGRAFGIHVLLGSQTLAGAYSLPRSTIGQMAVRVALQCSEADAHLILSEDNTAARLLQRPGEAIYNDANGLFEGNHPFQISWLADHERDAYLGQISELAVRRNCRTAPPIVFEGNLPADPSRNQLLEHLLSVQALPDSARTPKAWLGAAVAIKDPTLAAFSRQGGSNLMLVGHREEAALGVLATCLVSLAAHDFPSGAVDNSPAARFYVLDGMRPDAPEAGFWQRLAPVVPQSVEVANVRRMADVIGEIARAVSDREASGAEDDPPIYLFIYDLGRFRDLRKSDDDFGFSSMSEDKPASVSKQFIQILRDGPTVGVHTLFWCDTYNNLNRSLDRQSLRDVELRVLFQMNASDSSNLIDSPAAGGLGVHRAILYDEGRGGLEKFRPYGLPSDDWLRQVKTRLHARSAAGPVTSAE